MPRSAFVLVALLALAPSTPATAAPSLQETTPVEKPKATQVKPISDLSAKDFLDRLRAALQKELTEDQLEKKITLGVRRTWVDEHTYLDLFNVSSMFPNQGAAYLQGGGFTPGMVSANFRSATGRSYFVDCKVRAPKITVMAWSYPAGQNGPADFTSTLTPKKGHISFGIVTTGVEEVNFLLTSTSTFEFQGCTITPAVMTGS